MQIFIITISIKNLYYQLSILYMIYIDQKINKLILIQLFYKMITLTSRILLGY